MALWCPQTQLSSTVRVQTWMLSLLLCLEPQSSSCRFKLCLSFYRYLAFEWLLSSFSGRNEEINSDSVSCDCINTWGLSHCPLVSRPAHWEQHKTKSLQLDAFFSSSSPFPKAALPGCCLLPSWEQCLSCRNVFVSRGHFPIPDVFRPWAQTRPSP